MSKINAVRLINLNYNNNAIRISDETFRFNGESTLLSLRNGGGKSVLVQMMTAPFVHRRYQNAKDRPFAGYFTTNKPSFILIEWKLDQGSGYVLTGMMVRRSQEISEENQDELEMINFISEYRSPCQQDLDHLPVVEKTKKEITLKGFAVCRQLFESYKRERGISFFYYDMNNAAQSRQYFSKLAEYRIYYKEWESIIKKVNQKESGLSDLFADCRDEKGLVEKWFLEAVENKLNQDRNRMREFQDIMEKYTGQYRDNRSKIQRRDTIRVFEQEAEHVREQALQYQRTDRELAEQKGRIGDFLYRLHELEKQERANEERTALQIEELSGQLRELEYEKLSGEYYRTEAEENLAGGDLEMLRLEEAALERRREEIRHRLHLLACGKQRDNAEECRQERDQELQRLALCREKKENLEPERMALGGRLRQYYEIRQEQGRQERDRQDREIQDLEQEKALSRKKLEELRERERELVGQCGALEARTQIFGDEEDRFNREYREEWSRNLLGEYEPGALQITRAEYGKKLEEEERAKTESRKAAEQCREQIRSRRRAAEDKTAEKSRLEARRKEAESRLADYDRELSERKVILRYFGMEQEELFHREKILTVIQRKILDTDLVRQELEKEADGLDREYRKLSRGQLLELSEEFRNLLEESGIHFVYGMEWLKKNGFSPERNRKMVEAEPFLPYSLIMSAAELERLSGLSSQISTSFPVPILLREELEGQEPGRREALHSFGRLRFYVWFNEDLLDAEKLKELLSKQEIRMEKLAGTIETRKKEYREYVGHQEKVENQKVSEENYGAVKEEISLLERKFTALERELLADREELERLESAREERERQAARLEKEISFQNRRLADFDRFCRSYEEYRENCRLLEKNRKEKERVLNLQKLEQDRIAGWEQKLETGRNRLAALERKTEEYGEKCLRYQSYERTEQLLSETEAEEAEIRYEVITGGIGAEQRELEERARKAGKRYEKALAELKALAGKYRLEEKEWSSVRYDRKEESHQEILLEEQERKKSRQDGLIRQAELRSALLAEKKRNQLAQIKQRCGRETPLEKEKVKTVRFEEAIRKLEYEKEEKAKEEKQIQKKLQGYESNLAALAEYEGFTRDEKAQWETDPAAMTGGELTGQKGILIRDYNAYLEQRRDTRLALERVLNRMIRMEVFSEDFYRKPLESMLQLTEDGGRVLRQLDTTLASYQSLMEKLQVDISLVEKEKARIVELTGDYLKEVHDNLDKIDRNSTITIRERPVKMLKIQLPDWTGKESLYLLRLQDYIDDITARGIELLEQNQNLQEFLGTRMTTKGLYDGVVGIGNVQIRLYKVEAQREYPITWADVAKNSGGEGFLSAFVILSALLYYMRRDDTDIFADRNEGKVLLMDNPFAQTNASHLLKPLMDMAKKSNTQLICLSGLGGESIYSRFDNIYVLTLIAASLRKDMQYLKAEHIRGSEEETMLLSRIQVAEQQEFLF